MRVCATETEGTNTCSEWRVATFPRPQFRVDEERRVVEIELRVGCLEVKTRRNLLVMQHQAGLDHTCDSCCCVEMSDAGLDRSDCAKALLVCMRAKSPRQR